MYCTTCEYINYVTEHKKESKKFSNIKKVAKDRLGCMAYTGPTWDDPTGIINDGRRPLFVDLKGDYHTLDEFKEKYRNDPRIHIKRLHEFQRVDELIDKDMRGT